MPEIEAFLERAYTLEHTKRYSMIPVSHVESVASHSYFVCLGVRLLHDIYEFDLTEALCMAIAHDVAEIEISDVNHMVKRKFPGIAAAINEAENDAVKDFPQCIRDDLHAYRCNSVEHLIVKLADTLQVIQYATNEIKLGNTYRMTGIVEDTLHRKYELTRKLAATGAKRA